MIRKTLGLLAAIVLMAGVARAQNVTIMGTDPSTAASVQKVGDATNNAIRVRITASDVASGGTSTTDNTAFTQASGTITPIGGLYATSWTNPTAGRASIARLDINGGIYTNLDKVGTTTVLTGNGATGAGSIRVTIASDNTAFSVNSVESGTWTVQPGNTANTTQWLVKSGPFDACGTTTYDPASVLISDNTLDTLTSTTTCVDTIVVANVGSTQETITVQDIQGTPVQLLKVVPVAPGGSIVLNGLGGVKFASGIKYQASTANKLSIWVKGRQ